MFLSPPPLPSSLKSMTHIERNRTLWPVIRAQGNLLWRRGLRRGTQGWQGLGGCARGPSHWGWGGLVPVQRPFCERGATASTNRSALLLPTARCGQTCE